MSCTCLVRSWTRFKKVELIVLDVPLMAFFGLPERDLAQDRSENNEDLAVYTWGEESYDGLGDALQEGGDELNDETFGSTGPIGDACSSVLLLASIHPFSQARTLTSPAPFFPMTIMGGHSLVSRLQRCARSLLSSGRKRNHSLIS